MSNILFNRAGFVSVILAVVLNAAGTCTAQAHDIWLQPGNFKPSRGEILTVHQLAGDQVAHSLQQPDRARELPFLHNITPRFVLLTRDETHDLRQEMSGKRLVKPVVKRTVDFDGPALVAMEHSLIYTQHSRHEFHHYLEHEEFDRQLFEAHMGSRPQQSEAYARTLKTLVNVGKVDAADLHRRILGQKLEIILLQDPYRLDPGAEIEVQVLFDGKALPGALVKAYNSHGEKAAIRSSVRTNQKGIARIRLERQGTWLIRMVHLMPCSQRSRVDCEYADWESYWSSYSFELD